MSAPKDQIESAPRSRLWLWVFVAFAVQLTVWVAWLVLAAHHPVAEVPLVTPR